MTQRGRPEAAGSSTAQSLCLARTTSGVCCAGHLSHPAAVVLLKISTLPCREVYDAAHNRYRGRATAPLLIDKKQCALISNESADIVRMLNSVSLPGSTDIDLYPAPVQAEIDEVNDLVYTKVWLCFNMPQWQLLAGGHDNY